MSKTIIEGLEESKKQAKKSHYLGMSVGIVSFLTGMFFTLFSGELSVFFQPYLKNVPEVFVGMTLIIFGTIKVIGILTNNSLLRKVSIVALSFLWGSLFVVSTIYSFGIGFPSISFIFAGKIAADCMRISTRGVHK